MIFVISLVKRKQIFNFFFFKHFTSLLHIFQLTHLGLWLSKRHTWHTCSLTSSKMKSTLKQNLLLTYGQREENNKRNLCSFITYHYFSCRLWYRPIQQNKLLEFAGHIWQTHCRHFHSLPDIYIRHVVIDLRKKNFIMFSEMFRLDVILRNRLITTLPIL